MSEATMDPTLVFLGQLILGALNCFQAVAIAFLVNRRIRADRERRALQCPACRELERSIRERAGNGFDHGGFFDT